MIHSEPAELKKKAQQIAVMAHNTDTPQVLGEASKQLSHVTQEVKFLAISDAKVPSTSLLFHSEFNHPSFLCSNTAMINRILLAPLSH